MGRIFFCPVGERHLAGRCGWINGCFACGGWATWWWGTEMPPRCTVMASTERLGEPGFSSGVWGSGCGGGICGPPPEVPPTGTENS
jgi:hypothetical protein